MAYRPPGAYPPQQPGAYPGAYPPQHNPQAMGQSFVPPAGGAYPPMGQSFGPPPATFQGWAAQYYYQLNPQELQTIRQWFHSVDADRSGSITVMELKNVAFGGIPLGFDTSLKLIKVFDKDYSGTIDFYEYAALHKFIQSMQRAFTSADTNKNGQLDPHEIHGALYQSGFPVGIGAVQSLFRKYAKGRPGIGFSDYLGLVSDCALLRTKFEFHDQRRQGVIQVNLDTLIQMAADL